MNLSAAQLTEMAGLMAYHDFLRIKLISQQLDSQSILVLIGGRFYVISTKGVAKPVSNNDATAFTFAGTRV